MFRQIIPFRAAVWAAVFAAGAPSAFSEKHDEKGEAKRRGPAEEIYGVTGLPARFVWLEARRAYYYTAPRSVVFLAGIDTEDGKGERRLLKAPGAFSKPVFTPDGEAVVYTDLAGGRVFVVDWEGGEPRDLGKGFASDVWRDPGTAIDWVYLRRAPGTEKDPIIRRRMDDPEVEETVWDKTDNGIDDVPWFQLSRDGKRFSDAFPWNKCGIGNLKKMDWKHYEGGCWPGISLDEEYRLFVFSGNHKKLRIFDEGRDNGRSVSLSNIPGLEGKKVYHPRWSNHPRFLTVSAPKGGTGSRIYLGKFDEKWGSIEQWVKVSAGSQSDIFGDAWIKPPREKPSFFSRLVSWMGSGDGKKEAAEEITAETWPASTEMLLWMWENANAKNESPALEGENRPFSARGTLRGRARFGPRFELLLDEGRFDAGEEAGSRIVSACRKSNSISLEALVTPAPGPGEVSGAILALGRKSGGHDLALSQRNGRLILRGGDEKDHDLASLEAGRAAHVIVSAAEGRVTCWLDGKVVYEEKDDFLKPGGWEPGALLLGGEGDAESDWDGSLQRIAIYGRPMGPDEVETHAASAAAFLKTLPPAPERWMVEATLVEATRVPDLEELDTYRRALVENVYEIGKVVEGGVPGGVEKRIVVLEWVIMDRQPLPSSSELRPGARRRLTLESAEAHPELESEFRGSDHGEFLLPVFYDVNSHR